MRIISKFHDYYDTAMSYGQDSSITFVRNPVVVDNNMFPELTNKHMRRYFLYRDKEKNPRSISLNYILFCGEVIPVIKQDNKTYHYGWDCGDVSKKDYYVSIPEPINITIHRWFTEVPNIKEKLVESKITLGVVEFLNYHDFMITINPCLRDFEFYKIKDAFTAFQEISMYVGGVLSYPHNFMATVEDKYRFENHGFDPKYGFRKRK